MLRLEGTDSEEGTKNNGTNGDYYFSSWSHSERLYVHSLYKRYACTKVHIMKKIEQSGRGRDCGHWRMWQNMANALLVGLRKIVSPKTLENFFWDVIAEGSTQTEVTSTLERLLDCRRPPRRSSGGAFSRRRSKREVATSSDDSDEDENRPLVRQLPRRTPRNDQLPLDLSPHRSCDHIPHDSIKVERPSSGGQDGVVAVFEPTVLQGNPLDERREFAVVPAAEDPDDVAAVLDLVLTQVSIGNDCGLDVSSAAQYPFLVPAVSAEEVGLVGAGAEPMFSDVSGGSDHSDAALAVRSWIERVAADDPPAPPVELVDKGIQCDFYSDELVEMMRKEHLFRMHMLRLQTEAWHKQLNQAPVGCVCAEVRFRADGFV